MELNSLTALSPIDGRYRKQLHHLDEYFSEFALMKYRVLIEVEYFLFLADKKFFSINASGRNALRKMAEEFSLEDANEIKAIEASSLSCEPFRRAHATSAIEGGGSPCCERSRSRSVRPSFRDAGYARHNWSVTPGTSADSRPGTESGLTAKSSASGGTEPDQTGHVAA